MRVYFVRHGIAEDAGPGMSDHERQLTSEGIAKMKLGAELFTQNGVDPARIYSSPLVRARQTAEIIAERLGCPIEIADEVGPGFNDIRLERLLAPNPGDDIMVVGHEPDFSSTISRVIGGGSIDVRKGTLARVDLFSQSPVRGSLVWLLAPRLWGGADS